MDHDAQGVTIMPGALGDPAALHRAALVAAARAHRGAVVGLRGTDGVELARATCKPAGGVLDPPTWLLDVTVPAPRGAALLDRDGTVIEDRHYLAQAEGVAFVPGAVEGLRALFAAGITLVILTNQSGVARGRITPAQLEAVHDRLRSLLSAGGISLGGIYHCPHGPADGCGCRKPADGLAREAAAQLGFPVAESVVVGDRASDLELGRRLGVPAVLVGTGEGPATLESGAVQADYWIDDLSALPSLLSHPAGLPVPVRIGD